MCAQKILPIGAYNKKKRSQSVKWGDHLHDSPVNERKNKHENAFKERSAKARQSIINKGRGLS